MDEAPNSTNAIGRLLGERQRFAHQTAATLAKGVIETFKAIGLATGSGDGFVVLGRRHTAVFGRNQ
jgi:hypothetical protein